MVLLEKFGTIYIDGKPVGPGTVLPKYDPVNLPKIQLGNTVPGMEISWILVDDRLIADRNILRNVSWDLLDKSELTMRRESQIDNHSYRVRTLEDESGASDWNDLLDKVRGNECLIHWAGTYSLGAAHNLPHGKDVLIWGYTNPETIEFSDRTWQYEQYGWRPVLELKSLMACSALDLLDEPVLLYCEDGSVFSGVAAEVSEYDILLEKPNILGNAFFQIGKFTFCRQERNGLTLDRTAILDIFPWNIKTSRRLD